MLLDPDGELVQRDALVSSRRDVHLGVDLTVLPQRARTRPVGLEIASRDHDAGLGQPDVPHQRGVRLVDRGEERLRALVVARPESGGTGDGPPVGGDHAVRDVRAGEPLPEHRQLADGQEVLRLLERAEVDRLPQVVDGALVHPMQDRPGLVALQVTYDALAVGFEDSPERDGLEDVPVRELRVRAIGLDERGPRPGADVDVPHGPQVGAAERCRGLARGDEGALHARVHQGF